MIGKTFIKNFISNADYYYMTIITIFFRSLPIHIFTQLYSFKKFYLYGGNFSNKIDKNDIKTLWKLINKAPYKTIGSKSEWCNNFLQTSKTILNILCKYGLKQRMEFIDPHNLVFAFSPNSTAVNYRKMNCIIFDGVKWCNRYKRIDQLNITNLIHPCYYNDYLRLSLFFRNNEDVLSVSSRYSNCRYNTIINNENIDYSFILTKDDFIYKMIIKEYSKNIRTGNKNNHYNKIFDNKLKLEHTVTLSYTLTNILYKLYKRFSFNYAIIAALNIINDGYSFNNSLNLFIDKLNNIDNILGIMLTTQNKVKDFIKRYIKLNKNDKNCRDSGISIKLFNLFYNFYMDYINNFDKNNKMDKRKIDRSISSGSDKYINMEDALSMMDEDGGDLEVTVAEAEPMIGGDDYEPIY